MDVKIIGENIKKLRLQEELSQTQLAETITTHQAIISKIENGEGGSINILLQILKFFKSKGYELSNVLESGFVAQKNPLKHIKEQILIRKLQLLKKEINEGIDDVLNGI